MRHLLRMGRQSRAGFRGVGIPSGGSLLFFSDHRHALGSSANAQQDGNVGGSPAPKWNFKGDSSACEVLASTGLDFPSARCLRVPYSPATFSLIRTTQLPVLAVGVRRTYRWYIRCTMPESDARVPDWNFHPIQDGFAGSNCNWAFEMNTNQGANWLPWFLVGNGLPDGYGRWFMPLLPKQQTYRFEWQLYRNAIGTFQADCDVFNSAGAQVADSADFVNQATPAYSLVTVRGNVPTTGDFPWTDVNNTNGLNAGANDTYTISPADPALTQSYQGGFAVADNIPGRLIGAYPHPNEVAP